LERRSLCNLEAISFTSLLLKMSSQSINVEIPVLPHVKCLLISLYGAEPLRVNENNLLGRELQFIFLNKSSTQEKINGEKISIQVSHRLTPYFYKFKNAFSLGCYFEKQFHVLLFTHIEAQKSCGITCVNSIKNFFDKYSIDQNYYTVPSALEAYRRLKHNYIQAS
jgi:hypothetical protein